MEISPVAAREKPNKIWNLRKSYDIFDVMPAIESSSDKDRRTKRSVTIAKREHEVPSPSPDIVTSLFGGFEAFRQNLALDKSVEPVRSCLKPGPKKS
jgi:hypothetical protein